MIDTAVGNGVGARTQRKSYSRTSNLIELPRLIEIQLQSFEWFRAQGLKELFEEISPIVSFNKHLELHFGDFRFDDAKHSEEACRVRDITYSAPLWVEVRLVNNDTGEISEQEVFMGDFPLMTDSGTFIVNGSERVVVSQLIRSPGVYFTTEKDRSTGRDLTGTKLIPLRGAWLEFETSKRDIISVKVDRKRKLPATILLRAIGFGTDEEIRALFSAVDDNEDHPFIEATLERDPTANPTEDRQKGIDDALLEFYKKLRPGDPATLDNARNFLQNLLFTSRRYDLGRVGRYKLNRKLGLEKPLSTRILTNDDIVSVVRRIIDINNERESPDDIDHLGNRRIKTVGELIQSQLRIGLLRMERVVRERMSIREPEQVTPLSLINIRPVVAATREFFGSSQLSQFMDQTNPLAELTHKRRLSALGPGGLRRERAGFDVRDVHYSHYGRICPIETPEGPNIGLIGYLATYGRINDFGFIETPYRRVINTVKNMAKEMTRRILNQDIVDPYSEDFIAKRGDEITPETAQVVAELYHRVVNEVKEQLLSGLEQEEQSRIEEFTARIRLFSSEARSQADRLKDSIQNDLGEKSKEEQRLEWLDDVILMDDVVEVHDAQIVEIFKEGRLEALQSVFEKEKADIQAQIAELIARIGSLSSEARRQAEQLQEWIQSNLGEKAEEVQRLNWADAILSVDEVVEAKHDRMVDFSLQARLAALQSVSEKEAADIRETNQAKRTQLHQELEAVGEEEQSQLETLTARIDRSDAEARSQAEQLQKWIQSNLGKKAEEQRQLDWVDDAIVVINEVVEAEHEQQVNDCLEARLAALQSVSEKETADIRETSQAKRTQLHQELEAVGEEEQSQLETLTARIDRSDAEARSQAEQLQKWIQGNLGEKAEEVQRLNWADAILSVDEVVGERHERLVDYCKQGRLAALKSVQNDLKQKEEPLQIEELAARIGSLSSEARGHAKQLQKWIQGNLGEKAEEVQRLNWADAILSVDEVVEARHGRLVDYCKQGRLVALKSVQDDLKQKEEPLQIEELTARFERSSSEARRQAERLQKWIQSNLGKTAKEVQRLDWTDAIFSVDEVIETKHERLVDYCVQARLVALQSVSKRTTSFIREWIQTKRTRLETSSEEEKYQIEKLTERFDRSSSEVRDQAKHLQEWLQRNLGKKAKEDKRLNWVDAAVVVVDEVVEAEHEQQVNDYLEARLAALQSELREEETYIHATYQAKRNDELIGDKKKEEALPELDKQVATLKERDLINALREQKEFRVRPFVSEKVIYLNADTEERSPIAQASTPLDKAGHFLNRRPSVRQADDFRFEEPQRIKYMDVSPKQVVGVSAALIPFLEHDDTNRALMGSNMQRQAVPLVQPDAPIVGTGMEWQAAVDSGQVVVARKAGEAVRVVNTEIVIQEEDGNEHTYPLRKYNRSNQSTCIDQRPTIQKGDLVEAGTVLADSSSTQNGELALGQNVLVAYMSWEGGNYEDAILVSERLVENDKYTSVHIEKHEIEARETKLGPEEITRDIPNVGEDALKHLDEDGIIRIGAEVAAGDILVGKITPKGETELTPEEKLLRAIFGEKAREVKDSSLRLPHGERGKVVDIKVFTREDHQDMPAGVEMMVRVSIAQRRRLTEGDKMAGRHGNKGVISRVVPVEDMPFLEDGTPIDIILNPLGVPGRMNIGQVLETHLGWAADRLGFMAETPVFDGAKEDEIESELARAWLIDRAWQDVTQLAWASVREQEVDSDALMDDNDARRLYLLEWLEPRGYDPEMLFFDDKYARSAALAEWLKDRGYEAELVVPDSGSEVSDQYARYVSLREWLIHHGCEQDGEILTETADDPILLHLETGEQLDAEPLERFEAAAQAYSNEIGWPLPTTGKQKLFDGKTGEPYDAHVTVGIAQMLKLHHLVEDKVHARSTGPYSLVTQQPLGGKAQFGGQRFGEMEVWALEAYGAAYTLQEMLTIKSDDTTGRVKTYEAIVKGDEIQSPGVPESFRVLVKELQSLALSIEVINEKNEVIQLGKDEVEDRLPHLGFSLNVPSPMSRSSE